ncbi:helix-hairpin-helix domain-containing protein [Caulobacter sp. KR2-114]|uniref:helix-hairpin-helix domain-containing protein n=1 Tax=Caulobacter sp. KR2-114 TaxID=3400912 RepID=UPI003BFB5DDB
MPPSRFVQNAVIAGKLRHYARLLEEQRANPFRVRAFAKAADVVAALPRPVGDLLAEQGREGLTALPAIGEGIATAVAELASTGRWSRLERLSGGLEPEALFRSIPGIGPRLARQAVEDLHLGSLEALEAAAHDGRLDAAPGWGARRVAMVRAGLAERLGARRAATPGGNTPLPDVGVLLDVDREYREAAASGHLQRIAPRRFNPAGEAWLPVLHTERGPWRFTALFSNTARAHELGRTRDWVVLYHERDGVAEGRHTVVTETQGPLAGRRVVRGREAECERLGGAPLPSGFAVAADA